MQKITTFTLTIALSIFVLTSCNQISKQSDENKQGDGTNGGILNIVSSPKDDLTGDFAIKEGGEAEIKITKENENYFVSINQNRGWSKPEQLSDVPKEDFVKLFGENWKSYVKGGLRLNKDPFAIFKVEKGYQNKDHTFKTGYFVVIIGGDDLYKL